MRLNLGIVSMAYGKGFFWLRVLGRGFHIKNTSLIPLLPAEKEGAKGVRLGKYRMKGYSK